MTRPPSASTSLVWNSTAWQKELIWMYIWMYGIESQCQIVLGYNVLGSLPLKVGNIKWIGHPLWFGPSFYHRHLSYKAMLAFMSPFANRLHDPAEWVNNGDLTHFLSMVKDQETFLSQAVCFKCWFNSALLTLSTIHNFHYHCNMFHGYIKLRATFSH